MVALDSANSRMKDFYDIWLLVRHHPFDGHVVSRAIEATFAKRQTAIPVELPTALTERFVMDHMKQTQWKAFVRKGRLAGHEVNLSEVVALLREFLMPPTRAAARGTAFEVHWPAGGPWA